MTVTYPKKGPYLSRNKTWNHYIKSGGCPETRWTEHDGLVWCNGVKGHTGEHWAALRVPTKKVPNPKVIRWTSPQEFYALYNNEGPTKYNPMEDPEVMSKTTFVETITISFSDYYILDIPKGLLTSTIRLHVRDYLCKRLYLPVGKATICKIVSGDTLETKYVVNVPVVDPGVSWYMKRSAVLTPEALQELFAPVDNWDHI